MKSDQVMKNKNQFYCTPFIKYSWILNFPSVISLYCFTLSMAVTKPTSNYKISYCVTEQVLTQYFCSQTAESLSRADRLHKDFPPAPAAAANHNPSVWPVLVADKGL